MYYLVIEDLDMVLSPISIVSAETEEDLRAYIEDDSRFCRLFYRWQDGHTTELEW